MGTLYISGLYLVSLLHNRRVKPGGHWSEDKWGHSWAGNDCNNYDSRVTR